MLTATGFIVADVVNDNQATFNSKLYNFPAFETTVPQQALYLLNSPFILHQAGVIAGEPVASLPTMFRKIWALGSAGVPVPLTLQRDGRTQSITVDSGARADYLKKPNVN